MRWLLEKSDLNLNQAISMGKPNQSKCTASTSFAIEIVVISPDRFLLMVWLAQCKFLSDCFRLDDGDCVAAVAVQVERFNHLINPVGTPFVRQYNCMSHRITLFVYATNLDYKMVWLRNDTGHENRWFIQILTDVDWLFLYFRYFVASLIGQLSHAKTISRTF